MRRIAIVIMALTFAAPAAAQRDAAPARAPVTAPAGAAPVDSSATAARKTAARGGAAAAGTAQRGAPSPAARRSTAPANASARTGVAPRRLEDIHIEGEIPAPQVLFITARDQRRFLGSQHRHFLRTAREVAEATPLPSAVIVTRPEPGAPR